MIKRFFAWLKSIYFHPAEGKHREIRTISSTSGACTVTAELADTTSGSIQVYFVAVLQTTSAILDAALSPGAPGTRALISLQDSTDESALYPLAIMKADFEKVVAFIEHGIEVLGKDAEADLVALKNKIPSIAALQMALNESHR